MIWLHKQMSSTMRSILQKRHLSSVFTANHQWKISGTRLNNYLQQSTNPRTVTPLLARSLNTNGSMCQLAGTALSRERKVEACGIREGAEIEGFVVEQVANIPEFYLTAVRLKHLVTGADYLHIIRDDSNNVFSVAFRTTPMDSTGLAHILEHTVLCGSDKFPCRDPFFKMLSRSLATFINAMTGPDFTMYPFSTQNSKDFENLMSVYLDAVFRPQLKELDFKQEGWRLEHEDPKDPNSPIVIKGVVFNEMKGVFSENQQLFEQNLLNSILPSHTYGYVSGGDPLVIPKLTWNDLKSFHAQCYHPSNSRFYTYGNLPLVDHLRFINKNYLSTSSKIQPRTDVPSEIRWNSAKRKHIACRFDPMCPDPNKQSTLAVSYLCSDVTNIHETFVLQVLSQLLVKGPNTAFYKSLVEPNIGAGFAPATGYDSHTKDTTFSVGLQGLSDKDFDKVINIIDKTVDDVVLKGFDEKHVEAVLHGIELNMKHQTTDFGMSLAMGLVSVWNHGGNIIEAMQVNSQVEKLRGNMQNNKRYLQEKVEQYLKNNTHKLILSMSPESDFEKKQENAEQAILQSNISSLSEKERQRVHKEGQRLLQEQEKEENLSYLPTLHMSDLKRDVDRDVLLHTQYDDIPVQVCSVPTNDVTYFRGILNTSHIDSDMKHLLPLFAHVVTRMGTKKNDFRKLDQFINLKTGGLSFASHLSENNNCLDTFEEGLLFSSYCLDKNIEDMFNIWSEIFNEVTLDDLVRFETLTKVLAADLSTGIADMGHHYAMSSAAGLVNASAALKENLSGLTYILKMKQLSQTPSLEHQLEQMQNIGKNLLSKRHLRCAVNLSPQNKTSILNQVDKFVNTLPGRSEQPLVETKISSFKAENKGIHYLVPIPVNFAAKCVPAVPYEHRDFAPLRILSRLVTYKYLHPNIREKGGAYGSGASLSGAGVIQFFSYRDPNSTKTFDIFDGTNEWVSKNEFTEQDIEEAKLGVFQRVDAPVPPESKGMHQFIHRISDERRQQHRQSLMDVTREDLLRVSSEYLKKSATAGRSLLGPENSDTANSNLWNVVSPE